MFEMGADEAWDIDEELDFAITDFLMQQRKNKSIIESIRNRSRIQGNLMKKFILKVLNAPWYFIPFAAYPVLALLSHNISQVRYTAGIRPLIISAA